MVGKTGDRYLDQLTELRRLTATSNMRVRDSRWCVLTCVVILSSLIFSHRRAEKPMYRNVTKSRALELINRLF